jgi:hypothetical protein
VRVPAGSRALHSDYYRATKKPAFSLNAACPPARRQPMLRFDERGRRARHCAARSCAATREFFRLVENADNIRGFDTSVFFAVATYDTRARRARSKKLSRRCVRHAEQLVQKIVNQEACKSGLAVDSSADRANRLEVIRSSRALSPPAETGPCAGVVLSSGAKIGRGDRSRAFCGP